MLKPKRTLTLRRRKWSIILIAGALIASSVLGLGLAGAGATPSRTARPDAASKQQPLKRARVAPKRGQLASRPTHNGPSTHSDRARKSTARGSGSTSCSSWCTPTDEPALDAAVDDAREIAGGAYYTGAVVDTGADTVTIYMAHAPQSVIDQLESTHPGIYVIQDNAPRSRSAVMEVANSIDMSALRAHGIDVVGWGPTEDGFLRVGVTSDVAAAQKAFDAQYGPNLIRVYKGQMGIAW